MEFRLGNFQYKPDGWPIKVYDPAYGVKEIGFINADDSLDYLACEWIAKHIVQNLNDVRGTMLHQLAELKRGN